MLILYTAQSCSTAGEVISIAIYYKHWSHFLASGASKDGLGMERVNVQSGKKKITKSFLAFCTLCICTCFFVMHLIRGAYRLGLSAWELPCHSTMKDNSQPKQIWRTNKQYYNIYILISNFKVA